MNSLETLVHYTRCSDNQCMSDWRTWDYFPKSTPRAAKGGIRAQSQRGGFGQSWWARRWIAVLESFNMGARLQRGRSYARSGQVLSIAIGSGSVSASVQGSRPQPYRVSIELKPLSKQEWRKLADVVSSQAIYGAKLMGGEMPQDIETAFQSAGLSLFPQRRNDLHTSCSCPDSSNPCKHIAAVYYLLGEEFDRDPFLVFQLRGMARKEFLGLLGEPAGAEVAMERLPPEPLPTSAAEFWIAPPLPEHLIGDVSVSPSGAALLRRLGKFPFWRGREGLVEALEPVYRSAALRASQAISEGIDTIPQEFGVASGRP
jgi:uncharacterized Zn finger protein